MHSIKYYIFFIFCLGSLISCEKEEIGLRKNTGYSLYTHILDYESVLTRAQRTDEQDLWITKSFDYGDLAGFYSLYGNSDSQDGNGSFNNVPMTYTGNKFTNEDVIFNTDFFIKGSTFYYYPYCENVDYDPSHTQFTGDNYGIELREKDEKDGIDKPRDLLWIINAGSATSASFGHTSSSIVFLRGEGFKNAKNREIKVVMVQGVSHAVVEDNKDYLKNIRFIYLEGYQRNGKPMSEEECKIWYAWEGKPYQVNDETSIYNQQIFEDAQYIILPSSRSTSRLSVDHIEVYDDNNQLKTIANFNLYENDKRLYYGQQYPVLIKMQELEATIVPISIKSWEKDVTIEENRAFGIDTPEEFLEWALKYNAYMSSNQDDSHDSELQSYGDKTVSNGVTSWKFYLNNDIDLTGKITKNQKKVINNFIDCFEGNNHTILGLQMECSTPPALIGTFGESGMIRNLNFSGMKMICNDSADSDKTENAGGLCSEFKGTLDNCNIDGEVRAPGRKVGLIAGSAYNHIVKGCVFSGILTGSQTADKMFGEKGEALSITNNNSSGLLFIESN